MRWLLVLLVLVPSVSAWEFTEIMANPAGGDSGREWVELYGDALDDNARFVEDGGSHYVTWISGECALDCVILIADEAALFFGEAFADDVLLYDSAWGSLRNTGEEVSLIVDSEVVALASYGDAVSGLSWQEGVYKEPTPGSLSSENTTDVPEFSFWQGGVLVGVLALFVLQKHSKNHMK